MVLEFDPFYFACIVGDSVIVWFVRAKFGGTDFVTQFNKFDLCLLIEYDFE